MYENLFHKQIYVYAQLIRGRERPRKLLENTKTRAIYTRICITKNSLYHLTIKTAVWTAAAICQYIFIRKFLVEKLNL